MSGILDGPDCVGAERDIDTALAALGPDSDSVAGNLLHGGFLLQGGDPAQALCIYLQQAIDCGEQQIIVNDCDGLNVDYQVINPDGVTWTHGSLRLPWPVILFLCRYEGGEFEAAA